MPVTPVFRGRGWRPQAQPWLHSETQSQKNKAQKSGRKGKRNGGSEAGEKKPLVWRRLMSVSSEIKCDILPVINHYYVFLAGYYSVIPDSRGGTHRRAFFSVAQTFVFIHKG